MANIKISELPQVSTLVSTDVLPSVASSVTSKITVQNLANTLNSISYLRYVALLGQIGTDAPQVIILENTIGDIVWTRQSTGDYRANLVGAFPANKTWCSVTSGSNYGNTTIPIGFCKDDAITDNVLRLQTGYIDATGGTVLVDINSNDPAIVYEYSIEIRVYN